jgi:transcriptional regulator with XRE-family HTH domain
LLKQTKQQKFLLAFGENLRKVRKGLGYSQEQLAYEAGIELRQIGRIERGEINTGVLSVFTISQTLGIPFTELLNFELE